MHIRYRYINLMYFKFNVYLKNTLNFMTFLTVPLLSRIGNFRLNRLYLDFIIRANDCVTSCANPGFVRYEHDFALI